MENLIILSESTRNSMKSKRKYKCPYCDERYDREKLIDHIEKKHEELIPEGYTAARVVFNMINKKDHGTCVICKKESPWREDIYRYDRYCCEKCKKEGARIAKANMIEKYGQATLLNNPDHQKKMLKNRSISGSYKFSSGGSMDYVGSFEKKFLEFCDKVMGFKVSDFSDPPIIPYEYNGENHYWILDFYLEPFNLLFDIKDGGDNPNNREMKSYREKQLCKEKGIRIYNQACNNPYNYIRLTNNNFAQLMLVLAEIKMQMMDISDETGPIIRIFESADESRKSVDEFCSAVGGAMVGINNKPSAYVVPYIKRGSFAMDYAITDDPNLEHILTIDTSGEIIPKDFKFLDEECDQYWLFKYNETPFKNSKQNPQNLYEAVTGKRLLTPDQIFYDSEFESILTPNEKLKVEERCLEATLRGSKGTPVPFIVEESRCIDTSCIEYYGDDEGYYGYNHKTGLRTKTYKNHTDIPDEELMFINDYHGW